MCGTREFMAPEMISADNTGYDFSQDWWSLGCLIYEMFCSQSPFSGMSDRVVTDKILNAHPSLPKTISPAARSLISLLLEKDPSNRLGSAEQIKKHAFFDGFDWDKLSLRQLRSSCIP